jgi:PAS domain S-box-containing protein
MKRLFGIPFLLFIFTIIYTPTLVYPTVITKSEWMSPVFMGLPGLFAAGMSFCSVLLSLPIASPSLLSGLFPQQSTASIAFLIIDSASAFQSPPTIEWSHPGSILPLLFMGTVIAFGDHNNKVVARESLVENMPDGWILIDANREIIDLNAAGANILGVDKKEAMKRSFDIFGVNLPLSQSAPGIPANIEIRKVFKRQDTLRFYNVQILTIASPSETYWQLLIWRDITEHKLAQHERQIARDEMFVLLNAISSEASQSASLSDFLDGAIYQLVFAFRNQTAIVYLLSNIGNGELNPKIYKPVSFFGIDSDHVNLKNLDAHDPEFKLFKRVFALEEPILFEKPVLESNLPEPLRRETFDSVLLLPLIVRHDDVSKNIGVMFLARKGKPAYNKNEIVRLGYLADHIANLVDNEHRRKLAVAISERKRLMRDLHDSVSQKLYGLVALTEAAQAILEAGRKFEPEKTMALIGENARQAVKEMRLFLHQMQPIEIEKEGFISALHHRLAAVEGRADIKAGLIADETIKLPTEVEIALYYISQEALNNVIRHAKADEVIVTFKQTKRNLVLKITDNGKGFDTRNSDTTGLGFASMKERTEQLNGQIKIKSAVGKGTILTIVIPKNNHTTLANKAAITP